MAVAGAARMNARTMSAGIGGITLPLPLVMSAPERGDVLRATLESIAYAVRANLEQAEEVAGCRATELHVGGGMSRSAVFVQILADVVARPVTVASTPQTTALGAAAVAAPALGAYETFDEAASAMVQPGYRLEPAGGRSAEYEDFYQRWLAMCEAFEGMA
jgi:sugar (pentulose or hexulose) kinase